MKKDLNLNQIFSKILISAISELVKYDLRSTMLPALDLNKYLKEQHDMDCSRAYLIDDESLEEFNQIKNRIFHLFDEIFIFNLDFDLTKERYPISKFFLGTRSIKRSEKERGQVFAKAFADAYLSMIRAAKTKQNAESKKQSTNLVLNFLDEARVHNDHIFTYLGFHKNKPFYDSKMMNFLIKIQKRDNLNTSVAKQRNKS
jgi:hypothetical protein